MTRRNSRMIAVLMMTVCVAAAGCAKEEQPAPPPANPAKPGPKAVQSQSTSAAGAKGVQKQVTSSLFSPKGLQQQSSSVKRGAMVGGQPDFSSKKDPFKPYIVEPAAPPARKGFSKAKNANLLPIQNYDVNKFKLVGIIDGLKQNRALIVDPLNKGYVVKVGMQLGNNNGRITRITSNAVEVLEQFMDDNGKPGKRTVRLVLTQKSKETVR